MFIFSIFQIKHWLYPPVFQSYFIAVFGLYHLHFLVNYLFVLSHSKVNNIKDLFKYQMLKKCFCYQRIKIKVFWEPIWKLFGQIQFWQAFRFLGLLVNPWDLNADLPWIFRNLLPKKPIMGSLGTNMKTIWTNPVLTSI